MRIYTPLDYDWLADNPGYEPVMAYEGHIEIPSLGGLSTGAITRMTAQKFLGDDRMTIAGRFSGVSLANLTAAVGDLTGGAEALFAVPPTLQTLYQGVELSLDGAVIAIDRGDNTAYQVEFTAFTIGTHLEWPVAGFDDLLSITLTSIWVYVAQPFDANQRLMRAIVSGRLQAFSVDFDLTAHAPDFMISAQQSDDRIVALNTLFDDYFPDFPALPAIQVSGINILVDPPEQFEYSMVLAAGDSWSIDDSHSIESLNILITNTGWQFSGNAPSKDNGIPVFALLARLAQEIDGFELVNWSALNEIKLQHFMLNLDFGTLSSPQHAVGGYFCVLSKSKWC